MVAIMSLWLPIVVSAVLVFVVSSVIHMMMTYHRGDFGKLPDEEAARATFTAMDAPPGDYIMPCADEPGDMSSPEMQAKFEQGPVAFVRVLPPGPIAMGQSLVQWFVYCLVVGVFVAYMAGRTVGAGTEYLAVFRVAGAAAFMCYAVALWQQSIWFKRPWNTTLKHTFDGLLYALVTAGTFGWLWP